jgi:hypothetical protein
MATNYHKIKGKLKWCQNLFEPDDFRGSRNYKVNMYDIDESIWKKSGVQTRPREDKEGDVMYTLKRPTRKMIKDDLIEFDPPEVVMENGESLEGKTIGNGSEAIVEFITYDTSMGMGHRFNKVIITNLVEYVKPTAEDNPLD